MSISLVNVFKYYEQLPHQNKALEYLQEELAKTNPELLDNSSDFVNIWKSCSINTKAKIGPNEGMKFDTNQIIPTKNDSAEIKIRQLRYKDQL